MSQKQVPSPSSRKQNLKRSEESLTKKISEVQKQQAKSKREAMTSKKTEKAQKKKSRQESQGPEVSVKDYLTENQSESIAPAEDICENKKPNKKRKPNQNESQQEPAQLSKSRALSKQEVEKNPVLQEKTKKQQQSQQSHLKRIEQRAKIAQKVIRMIESPHQVSELEKEAWGNDPQFKKVKSQSLAERIKKALRRLNTNAQSRGDVLQLFTEGVVPSQQIFHQKRIQDAKMGPKKDKRFIYCPNSIISSQIFSIFSSDPPEQFINLNKYLLKGYKGISKTVSVSLLWHLTRFIDEYRLNSANIESGLKKTFNEPIIAYWSFLKNDTIQTVLQKLLQQLPHLKQKFNSQQIIQKKLNIGKFYRENYGLKVHLAIDQINTLAKYFRKIKFSIQQSEKNKQKSQKMDEIHDQMELVEKISSMFDKTIYLSSMDIEQAFLKQCDLDCNGRHTIVDVREVEYARDMYKTEVLTDLCHFYVFAMNERVLKPSNLAASEQELRQAQQECIRILQKRMADKEYFYMTFYSIFQQVKQIQKSNQGKKIQRADIKQFLTLKFQQAVKLLTQQAIDQFNDHFFKKDGQDDSRKYLILKLFFESEKIVDKQNSISYAHKKQHQLQGLDYSIPLKNLGLENGNEAKGKLPLTFFSMPSNQTVKLRLPAKLTSKIIKPKIAQSLAFYLKNAQEWMEKSTPSFGLAGNVERLLVFAIKNIETGFQLQYKINNNKKSIAEKYLNIRKGSYQFQSLKTGGKQQSLLEKLKLPLQKMLDNKHQCTVLEPVTLNFVEADLQDVNMNNLNETSKGIDFIMARVQPFCGKQQFHLDLIDVTVENSLEAIEKKMNDFLKTFLSFEDKHEKSIKLKTDSQEIEYPVWLRYFIYCQKNQHPKLLNKLRKTFAKSIKFEGQPDANYYEVKFLNKNQSLLYAVGFINMESDITFQSKRQGDINVQSLKKVFEVLNKRREMKKQNSNKSN